MNIRFCLFALFYALFKKYGIKQFQLKSFLTARILMKAYWWLFSSLQALRSCDGTHNPVYVSPGNLVTMATAVELAYRCCRHRVPEPIRMVCTVYVLFFMTFPALKTQLKVWRCWHFTLHDKQGIWHTSLSLINSLTYMYYVKNVIFLLCTPLWFHAAVSGGH